jgi:hypothetical protein
LTPHFCCIPPPPPQPTPLSLSVCPRPHTIPTPPVLVAPMGLLGRGGWFTTNQRLLLFSRHVVCASTPQVAVAVVSAAAYIAASAAWSYHDHFGVRIYVLLCGLTASCLCAGGGLVRDPHQCKLAPQMRTCGGRVVVGAKAARFTLSAPRTHTSVPSLLLFATTTTTLWLAPCCLTCWASSTAYTSPSARPLCVSVCV